MTNSKVRWGILSTAGIARKNWKAIYNTGNGVVVAVASRDIARSRAFITECQREVQFETEPVAYGTYEGLLASKDVDAVYIPLPTGVRKEWVLRAAEAGKHVVCEKPCATSVENLREMIEACRRHQVQFMDGVMFTHSRRMDRIREVLEDGKSVGDIKRIAAGFSFCAPPDFFEGNIRSHSNFEPDGCLGDLGWYCLRFTLWTMQAQLPLRVTGRFLSKVERKDSPAPVPTEFSAELFFSGGVSATFYCSFLTELQQWVHVSGTQGSLRVADFVLPNYGCELGFDVSNPSYHINGCEFVMEPHLRREVVREYSNSHPEAQETNLFREFGIQIRSGRLNESWPDIALKTQQVMEACLKSARADGQSVSLG